MRHLQELVLGDSFVLKPALSSSELSTEVLWIIFASTHFWEAGKTHSVSQAGWADLFLPAGFYNCKQIFKTKQNKKLTSNISSLIQNMWDASLDAFSFPGVKLRHTSSLLPWSVWKLFFPSPSFSFPSFLVLICGTRMTLISASLLFIHVTSLTALHQIRLLGFRRALRRHWELL